MTIGDDIERVAGIVAPELGIPVLVTKALGFVLILAVIVWVGWKLFFAEHQAQRAHDKAAAHAGELVGAAQGAAGASAANTVADNAAKEAQTHAATTNNYYQIQKQPGASDPVSDPVWNAFVQSVCLRSSAAGLPDCQRLPKADPQ